MLTTIIIISQVHLLHFPVLFHVFSSLNTMLYASFSVSDGNLVSY